MRRPPKPLLLAVAAVVMTAAVALLFAALADRPAPIAAVAPVPAPVAVPDPEPVPEPAPVVQYGEPLPAEPEPAAIPEPMPQVAVLAPPLPPLPAPVEGTPAWLRNAVPAPATGGKPVIAIVIDDLGLDRRRSARTVTLPGPLTLAWLPYAHDLREQTRAARAAGHELMLHIPMEPSVKADPGPNALLVAQSADENRRRFAQALASFDGYVGVNNHMGSRFTADRAAMAPVLAEVRRRGLLWLDSRTAPSTVAAGLAKELALPFAGRDVFLDNVETVGAVRAQLAKTEAVARKQGFAVAIGHPHDSTIEALAGWLPDMQRRGFVLVPISAVVRARCACG